MSDFQKQIEDIEKEIRETPYHKGTEHHIGILRARLSRLKDKMLDSEIRSKGGSGGGGYAVKHQGDATIVLVGPPSVGKSTLLNALTNAQSKVAPYSFTTVSVIPGMMDYRNAKIQILDVPGLIEGAEVGKGRGKEVLSVIRGCDLLLLISEVGKENAFDRIKAALEKNGIRIDKDPPKIAIEKKRQGGVIIHSNIHQTLGKDVIKDIVAEMGIKNADIAIKEKLSIEGLLDGLSKDRVYIPSINIINKIDLGDGSEKYKDDTMLISAENKFNLERLKDIVFEKLEFITVYLVKNDQEPNFDNPLVVKVNTRLSDILKNLGSNFAENKIYAKIWGMGAKFPGQEISLSSYVKDGMQIRFI
jgi:uncharacterized protein